MLWTLFLDEHSHYVDADKIPADLIYQAKEINNYNTKKYNKEPSVGSKGEQGDIWKVY